MMLGKFLCAAAALFVSAALFGLLRRLMLTPVRPGKNTRQELCLTVTGPEPALEHHVAGLLWLNDSGVLRCRITIRGSGLDEETRLVARALERDSRCVRFIEEGAGAAAPAEREDGPWISRN